MDPHPLVTREKLPALGLVVFGALVTILGAAVLLPSLSNDCSANIVMDYCNPETIPTEIPINVGIVGVDNTTTGANHHFN